MTTTGRLRPRARSELGDRDLELGEHFEQIGLERLVGAVELVDQQHRRHAVVGRERFQQRPLQQESLREDIVRQRGPVDLAGGLGEPDLDHLPRVVPFIHRRCDVEAFVALEPHELAVERRRKHLGDFGFADTGLSFEKQGPAHLEREEHARRETTIGNVVVAIEQREDGVDVGGR